MTARQQSLISKVPRYAALLFDDKSCGIVPTTKISIVAGILKPNESIRCIWDGEEIGGTVAGLSNSPSELGIILQEFESRHSSTQPSPDSSPSPPPPKKRAKLNPSTVTNKKKPNAQTLTSGSAAVFDFSDEPLTSTARILYNMDEDVTEIISNSTAKVTCQETQTQINTINNATQTDTILDLNRELMQTVLTRINQLEGKVDRLLDYSSASTPHPGSSASSEVFTFSTPPRSHPRTPTMPKERTIMTEMVFWYLTPTDVLGRDTITIAEAASKCLPVYITTFDDVDIDEIKTNSLNQRNLSAKNLVNSIFQLGELYNRNVNGRVSHGMSKDKLNADKIKFVRDSVFKLLSCLPSDEKRWWSECVKSIDKSTVYLFGVLHKKFDLEPILPFLS
ncbi:uncharacterized protein [Argopecten irradians]|uniref:uncharacterized protein n=1 Tax=Argopecten irradians TaxID=31199 RepID=UPI003721A8DB